MGIKHFFVWFRNHYPECVLNLHENPLTQEIDTLGLDLNSIFHPICQKVYQYGAYDPSKTKTRTRFLTSEPVVKKESPSVEKVAQEICNHIEELVMKIKPKKRLLLCVDGVAGLGKMSQQRQRRFRSAKENKECVFDANCLTPGTEFMHLLTSFIEKWIAKKHYTEWSHLEIVFSSEKVHGEGEHKIMQYIRKKCVLSSKGEPHPEGVSERFCIYGLDADLIMLCLALNVPNIFIYRVDPIRESLYLLNIGLFGQKLKEKYTFQTYPTFDFILLCFLMGNDFLPQIPTLEILRGGIDRVLSIYEETCPDGLLTKEGKDWRIQWSACMNLLKHLGYLEKDALKEKYQQKHKYFPDLLMEEFFTKVQVGEDGDQEIVVEWEAYQRKYYEKKFGISCEEGEETRKEKIEKIGLEYIRGLQWIITYYTDEIPTWDWGYPYHYAPFMSDMAKCRKEKELKLSQRTSPYQPFLQLLAVLPIESHSLLPAPLDQKARKVLKEYYPDDFVIDCSGKAQDWEAIIVLPIIELEELEKKYLELYPEIQDTSRNITGKVKTWRKKV